MSEPNLIRTGIAGLDSILQGGIPRDNVILVQGAAGTGKTLLGMEFIYRGMTEFNEPGMIVVFETSPAKLIRDAATLGWNLEELQAQKKLQIIFTSPHVLDQELRSPDSLLLETALEMGAQRIFVDGIGLLRPTGSAAGPPHAAGPGSYRDLLQQLVGSLNRENLTTMLSHELSDVPEPNRGLEGAEFLVDTVIQLNLRKQDRRVLRTIEIIKSRGQDFDAGQHSLHITNGKGLEVFRRVQAPVRFNVGQPTSTARRSVIGVEALDALIGGGIYDGSTTMVVGVSGVGKTVLGTQLLREGARQGKRGLLVSLDEHPAQIVRNAESLGLDLQQQVDAGTIQIMFESPQELNIDSHFANLIQLIEKHDIQRLVIDGMASYSTALLDRHVYRDFFHALVAYSKFRLMTTFFNYENPEFLGIKSYMPEFPVSSIVDNIILLSLVELGSSLHRCVTVVKARGSEHEFDSREYVIQQGGIALLPPDEKGPAPLPFSRYSSILSRAPTRLPAAIQSNPAGSPIGPK